MFQFTFVMLSRDHPRECKGPYLGRENQGGEIFASLSQKTKETTWVHSKK